jgi:hypothetical protein
MGDGPVVHQLGLPCLAVQVHGDGIAMERGPRSLCQSRRQRPNSMWELLRDSSGSQSIGQPFGVNLGAFYDMAGFEDVAQFVEQPVDAVVGLLRVVVDYAERTPLLISHRVNHPGDLNQMPLVVAGKSIELAGNQQGPQADRLIPSHLVVQQSSEHWGGSPPNDVKLLLV